MNQFEQTIFAEMEKLFRKEKEKVEIDQSDDEILHAFFEKIGDFDGAIMTEVNFLDPYKDKNVEAMQIFSTLSADIREDLFPCIEERLNELNTLCIFGAFGLYREGKQIFHKYVLPVSEENQQMAFLNIQTVWKEIFSTLRYLLPYVLIISNEKDFMSIEEYMEATSEAD